MMANSRHLSPQVESFQVEEYGGDDFPDLASAQRAALPILARDLAKTLRAMLASGALRLENGRIVPGQTSDEGKTR